MSWNWNTDDRQCTRTGSLSSESSGSPKMNAGRPPPMRFLQVGILKLERHERPSCDSRIEPGNERSLKIKPEIGPDGRRIRSIRVKSLRLYSNNTDHHYTGSIAPLLRRAVVE